MELFNNKILLITGGTGSFGSTMVGKLLHSNLKEIRVFSRDEKKQHDMRVKFNNKKLKFYLGDIRDFDSINDALRDVDFVFHAAALKQVPSCEFYPMEAVKTNILGAHNVMDAAIFNKVKKVIILSTDKAVYPINSMGISKAMMEKLAFAKGRNLSQNDTVFCVTRYGNVIGSRGSVIPHFIAKIKSEMPLTVTDPEMTRFLMSLDESVELVLHAFQFGEQGDLFVQKAPSCTVKTLANSLKKIYKSSVPIEIIGTRHGEKLFESLLSKEERAFSIETDKYFKVPIDNRDLNYEKYFDQGEDHISNFSDYNSHNTNRLNTEQVATLLKRLQLVD
jgi:UDP-N-acetylglucosamine 4,6-dehydratase/5-epimerase